MEPSGGFPSAGPTDSPDRTYAEQAEPPHIVSGEGDQSPDVLPFVRETAQELHRLIARNEVNDQFLRDAGMSREKLLTFAKKYEKTTRPRDNGEPEPPDDTEAQPFDQMDAGPDEEAVALGSGVDAAAGGLGTREPDEPTVDLINDLSSDFSDNLSPEYRELIEAYYKRLAQEPE